MKLSILIPMYNAMEFIGNTLESLLHQDLDASDYEIVIMDDGSTDDCTAIVKEYMKTHKNIVLHTQKNAGVVPTRKRLHKLAKGDFIYNIDADDYLIYDALGKILHIAIEKDLDIIGFDILTTEEKKLFTSDKTFPTSYNVTTGVEHFATHNNVLQGTGWYLISRRFMLENKLDFGDGVYVMDILFTYSSLLKAKRVVYLDIDIQRYLQSPQSMQRNPNHEHTRKLATEYCSVIGKLNVLIEKTKSNPEILYQKAAITLKSMTSHMIFLMFALIIKSDMKVKEIDTLLSSLKRINIYPMKGLTEGTNYSLKFKSAVFLYNRRYLFYPLLFPLRKAYKKSLVKLPI
ncbi:glycosyltransferase [Tamlana sp. 2_MG-2023]|uniref:glycosyltransferase n=1 Tax=unclassified Tamlana TaxID=2614803 RepID=UPI0026E285AE|nr:MULTISPECIES: glycosyltransferase [unclassified Tamlana]MDO6759381.1 glycosyltransferase [Tamlana sp. 2_MG-2023]MDO6790480.1 glycosyltransferase [Tamlana sp. 1_MG-2023]